MIMPTGHAAAFHTLSLCREAAVSYMPHYFSRRETYNLFAVIPPFFFLRFSHRLAAAASCRQRPLLFAPVYLPTYVTLAAGVTYDHWLSSPHYMRRLPSLILGFIFHY